MTFKDIKKIGVIGAGTMGRGIAQVFALFNYPIVLIDKESVLNVAIPKIKERTAPELWERVGGLITTHTDMKKVRDCDLIIEAVFEELEVKKSVFASLRSICAPTAIIATNTSAIPINELAVSVKEPSRFAGMHFMHPPKVMKLVEVVRGHETSDETIEVIEGLVRAIEKVPAVVGDTPGFVSNRLLFALLGEAFRVLESGVATKANIDIVMKYGMNHPMGPIELADFMGLDICLHIMEFLHKSLGDDKYRPTEELKTLVKEGKLGRKTGEGFYKYTAR
jgi:3-hydroxybutyryl-CoA dehydrogenase